MSTAYLQYSRKTAAILVVLAMVLALFPMAAFASHGQFTDVSGTLADEILAAHNAGLVDGYEDGSFRPNENVTRAAFAKMVVLALEKASGQALPGGSEPFSDVNRSQALYSYVVKAYNAKLINGYADGTFGYNKPINRQEAAAILQRALKLADAAENFADVPDNSAFAKAIGAVAAAGIMNGYNSTTFGPADNITRGQAAATAYRAYDYALPFAVAAISGVNAKQVQVRFTKPVDAETVLQKGASGEHDTLIDGLFSFTGIGDDAQAVNADSAYASVSDDGKVLTITASGSEYFSGKYAVTIADGIKSTAGAKLGAYSAVVTFADTVRPTVKSLSPAANGTVKVTFSEPIQVTNTSGFVLSVDGETVNINVNGPTDDDYWTTVTVSLGTGEEIQADKAYELSINGYVRDFAGNLITPNPSKHAFKFAEDKVAPTVEKIEALDLNTIRITFSEPIQKDTVAGTVTRGTTSVAFSGNSASAKLDSSGRVLTVDLESSVGSDGLYNVTVNADYTDLAGKKGKAVTKLVTFKADTTGPKIKSTSVVNIDTDDNGVTERYILVTFDELLGVIDTTKQVTGTAVVDGIEYDVTITGSIDEYDPDEDGEYDSILIRTEGDLSIDENTEKSGELPAGTYELNLVQGLVKDTADGGGNPNDSTWITVTLGVASNEDKAAPKVLDIQASGNDTIYVQFNEPVTNATALNVANYRVENETVFANAVFADVAKTKVKLTLKPDVIKENGPKVVSVQGVKDAAGNTMDPYFEAVDLTENVRPQLTSVTLTGVNEVTLKFSEPVTVDSGKVTVSVNGAPVSASIAVQGGRSAPDAAWVITLSQPLDAGDKVKVTIAAGGYTDANENKGAKVEKEITVSAN